MRRANVTVFALCFCLGMAFSAFAQSPPPIVIRSNTQDATIWAHERPSGPSNDGSVTLESANGAGQGAAAVNSTGSSLQMNANTVAQPAAVVTSGELPCEVESKTWTVGASICTASLPRTTSRLTGLADDAVGPVSGQATYACSNGVWAASPSSATCQTVTCPSQVNYWSASATCAAAFPLANSGQAITRASTNGNTGSATFTCNAGTWQLTANGGCGQPPIGSLSTDGVWYAEKAYGGKDGRMYAVGKSTTVGASGGPIAGTSTRLQMHKLSASMGQIIYPADATIAGTAMTQFTSVWIGGVSYQVTRCVQYGSYSLACR